MRSSTTVSVKGVISNSGVQYEAYMHNSIKYDLTHLPLDKMATSLVDDTFICIFMNKNLDIFKFH